MWYGPLKLLFTLSVHIDGQAEPVELECAYASFFLRDQARALRYDVMCSNKVKLNEAQRVACIEYYYYLIIYGTIITYHYLTFCQMLLLYLLLQYY